MQSAYRCYTHMTHMLYHLSNKEPQENVAMSTHHFIQKTLKVSAQVLLHFALNGSPINRGSHQNI